MGLSTYRLPLSFLRSLFDLFPLCSPLATMETLNDEQIDGMKVSELQEELKKRGQKYSGLKKAELQDALRTAIKEEGNNFAGRFSLPILFSDIFSLAQLALSSPSYL